MNVTERSPLWSLTASQLAEGYRADLFTPVDAMQAVLDRLDTVNPRVNGIIALDRIGALQAARESASRWKQGSPFSQLDGIPISIKDNLHLKGLPATWGSRLFADFVPDQDEPAIARLRAAGALLFGKTNVPEFAIQGYTSNLLFGTTVNPHAPGRTPGGSTGGGAAAVAAGIGPVAIGTDGGGSLRRPAAHCGLFGLKPSIGQVARYDGFPQILSDFEVIGAIGRSIVDLESVRQILVTPDPQDPRSLATLVRLPPLSERPRIAFMPAIGFNPVDARIAAETKRIARELEEAGAIIETIEAPFDYDRVAAAWGAVMMTGVAWFLAAFQDWQNVVNESAKRIADEGATRTAGQLLDALAVVADVRRAAGEFFDKHDLLLCPAIAALAWPAGNIFPDEIDGKTVGPRGHAVFTAWMNVAGIPAVNVPVAMTKDAGGVGLQIVAGHGRDRDILKFIESSPVLRKFSPAPLAAL